MASFSGRPLLGLFLSASTLMCKPPVRPTPPPATATAEEVAEAGASVLIGAGDIAACDSPFDEVTAQIIDSVLKADSAAGVSDAVFTTGDNVYPTGREQDFTRCFTPSWGNKDRRIMKKIRPVPGNHDYDSPGATPYYVYFGDKAGPPGKGYYAYNLGEWRIYALNSEIAVNPRFTALDRRSQEEWLAKDLADSAKKCVLAYWHNPLFSSSYHGSDAAILNIFDILYNAHADVVLTGHDHTYERFAPQTPSGVRDTVHGIVQFVIGTGGADLRGFRRPAPNSAARVEGYHGVLKLTLGKEALQWAFIDSRNRIWDPGNRKCH